ITVYPIYDSYGYEFIRGKIKIDNDLLNDEVALKHIIYHELGHWYGAEHGDCLIMVDKYSLKTHRDTIEKNWEAEVK
ncbi:MAG: hypothetical protein GTO02_04130, partial [Candidatus Dadabacteria bacterium]|nr:hypothetical protein [Candidatus Dadabacteria bacterium]